MPGVGHCRDCSQRIFWGLNPDGSGRSFPFDDPTHLVGHFSSCAAAAKVRDPWTGAEARVSRCAWCRRSIWWRLTPRGSKQPMELQPDGSAARVSHFDSCSGSPSRRAWAGPGWEEGDPVFRASAAPSTPAWRVDLDRHLGVLELVWPCSKDDVRSAYRRLALVRHPDHGGSHGAFIALKEAHDGATALLERTGGVPMP